MAQPKDINIFETIPKLIEQSTQTFRAKSLKKTRETLIEIIYSNERGIYIIDGENGSGKTIMVESILNEIKNDIYLIKVPPIDLRELLDEVYFMLRGKRFSQAIKLDEIKTRVNDAFKKINHTIIIDNLRDENLELIKDFNNISNELDGLKIIFSMNTNIFKGEDPLTLFSKGFRDKITIKNLMEDDISDYINLTFSKDFLNESIQIIKYSSIIFDFTKGNFSNLNNLILTIFEILKTGYTENLEKYQTVSECLIIMSAIEKELING